MSILSSVKRWLGGRTEPIRMPLPENLPEMKSMNMAVAMRTLLGGGYTSGTWVNDHRTEAEQNIGWGHVAITAIAEQLASATYSVYQDGNRQQENQSRRKALRDEFGSISRFKAQYGTNEEALKEVESDHFLMRLLRKPNPHEPGSSFRYRQALQLRLTGTVLVWNVPSMNRTALAPLGTTCERYVIPIALTTPVMPCPDYPFGGFRVIPNTTRAVLSDPEGFVRGAPFWSYIMGKIIDAREVQKIFYPHGVWLDDGQSPTSSGAKWIDGANSVDAARFAQMRNGADPSIHLALPPGVSPTQDEMDRATQKAAAKYGGPENTGAIMITENGAEVTILSNNAKDMCYHEGFADFKAAILALHKTPPIAIGSADAGSQAGYLTSMRQWSHSAIRPLCRWLADSDTHHLAPQFGEGLTIEIEPEDINDAQETNARVQVAIAARSITKNTVNATLGFKPLEGPEGEKLAGPDPVEKQQSAANSPMDDKKPELTDLPSPSDPNDPYSGHIRGQTIKASVLDAAREGAVEGNRQFIEDKIEAIVDRAIRAKMKSIDDIVEEEKKFHKFASTQFDVPPKMSDILRMMAKQVETRDLADDGRETQFHITALYGLHDESPDPVRAAIRNVVAGSLIFGQTSIFEGDEYDVVKVEILGDFIHEVHDAIASSCVYTKTHPTYNPHCTLAYVKPGLGRKYLTLTGIEGEMFTPSSLTFSNHYREAISIPFLFGINSNAITKSKSIAIDVELAAEKTDTNPTDAQKRTGDYKKGKVNIQGLSIAIENPRGSIRSGIDHDGERWSQMMAHHYGYIDGTISEADFDPVDVFIGFHPESEKVFVIDQVIPETAEFDEHKVMLGFRSIDEASAGYAKNYPEDWDGIGGITVMSMNDFKKWLSRGDTGSQLWLQQKSRTSVVERQLALSAAYHSNGNGSATLLKSRDVSGESRGEGGKWTSSGSMVHGPTGQNHEMGSAAAAESQAKLQNNLAASEPITAEARQSLRDVGREDLAKVGEGDRSHPYFVNAEGQHKFNADDVHEAHAEVQEINGILKDHPDIKPAELTFDNFRGIQSTHDLENVKTGIENVERCNALLKDHPNIPPAKLVDDDGIMSSYDPDEVEEAVKDLKPINEILAKHGQKSVGLINDGGTIRPDVQTDLEDLRDMHSEAKKINRKLESFGLAPKVGLRVKESKDSKEVELSHDIDEIESALEMLNDFKNKKSLISEKAGSILKEFGFNGNLDSQKSFSENESRDDSCKWSAGGSNESPKKGIEGLKKKLDDHGVDHLIHEKNGIIRLDKLIVPKESRGQGIGSRAMQDIADYADETNQRIALSPDTSFGASSRSRLVKFYKQFGFKENKGRGADLSVSESMIREPKSKDAKSLGMNGTEGADGGFAIPPERAGGEIKDRMEIPEGKGYGTCPHCGADSIMRERRIDGNDQCRNGHMFPSKMTIPYDEVNPSDNANQISREAIAEQLGTTGEPMTDASGPSMKDDSADDDDA